MSPRCHHAAGMRDASQATRATRKQPQPVHFNTLRNLPTSGGKRVQGGRRILLICGFGVRVPGGSPQHRRGVLRDRRLHVLRRAEQPQPHPAGLFGHRQVAHSGRRREDRAGRPGSARRRYGGQAGSGPTFRTTAPTTAPRPTGGRPARRCLPETLRIVAAASDLTGPKTVPRTPSPTRPTCRSGRLGPHPSEGTLLAEALTLAGHDSCVRRAESSR